MHHRVLTLVLVAASIVVAAPSAGAIELDKGPYIQSVTRTGGVVVWETRVDEGAHVRYGTTPDLPEATPPTAAARHHEVALTGLAEEATYFYALYQGDEAVSSVFSFRTAPGPAADLRFVVYGDNRSDAVAHAQVVAGVLSEEGVDFVVNTGDMVSDGEVESQWTEFFALEGELAARLPIHPVIGNHEESDGGVPIVDRLFVVPTDASGSEHYYAFTFGNSRFLVLDGHVEVEPWYLCLLQLKPYDACFTRDQDAFIQDELDAAAADAAIEHVFVFTHMGPYSSKEGRSGSAQMRAWLDRFAERGVDVVFSGHDHYYEHGHAANGLDYVITGGGGAPLYDVNPGIVNWLLPHTPILAEAIHHYVVVDVVGDWVQVTTRLPDGSVLERFDVGVRPPCVVAEDCYAGTPGACPGEWTCSNDHFCRWVCDPPPPCVAAADCPDPPEGICPGEWACALGTCAWRCTGGECAADADCGALAPLTDCAGGYHQCMDEVCEWVCPPPPPDAGGPGPDVADAGSAAPDVASEPDAGAAAADLAAPDTPAPPDAAAPPSQDDTPTPPAPTGDAATGADAASGPPGPPAGSGGGSSSCASAGAGPARAAAPLLPLLLLPFLLLFLLLFLRITAASRQRDRAVARAAQGHRISNLSKA